MKLINLKNGVGKKYTIIKKNPGINGKSVKKFVRDVREKIPTLYPKDYKPKKIGDVFDDKNVDYKSESNEHLLIEEYLENIAQY